MISHLKNWWQTRRLFLYHYLQRFCEEEDVGILPYSHDYEQLVLSDIIAYHIPRRVRDNFTRRKRDINNCLRYAYKNHILDPEKRSRLKDDDAIPFWSTVSEIKVGMWLENQQIDLICFQPPASNGGKGDFLVNIGDINVFVEVKTKFGDRYMLEQERLVSRIAQHFKVLRLPVHSVDLIHYPGGYDSTLKDAKLFRDLEESVRARMPLTVEQKVFFQDESDLELELELSPGASLVVSMMYGGFFGIVDELKSTLGMEVNGKTRKLQISNMNIPSIFIINDFSHNIDRQTIEDVLFGTLVEDTTHKQASFYREKDGKWLDSVTSDLSAVVVLRFEPLTAQCQSVDAYLCPNPKFRLPISYLPQNGISWWQLDNDGTIVKLVFNS